ncbi:MAG: toxin-antitoxin system YwqK family antitoxin [Parvibaculales bacterium]
MKPSNKKKHTKPNPHYKDGEHIAAHHDNGDPALCFNYKNGKLNGLVEVFYEDGQLLGRCEYKDDKLHGLTEVFDEYGRSLNKVFHKEGEPVPLPAKYK